MWHLAVAVSFLQHIFLFRWRTAMVEWYHSVYDQARTIEGASQRVQEDTIKFSRIMEGLGTSFIEAVMIIVEFIPILFGLEYWNSDFLLWRMGVWTNYWSISLVNWRYTLFNYFRLYIKTCWS